MNLLTLRPEICGLLLIRNPNWLRKEQHAAAAGGRPSRLAWEWLAPRRDGELPANRHHHTWTRLSDLLEPDQRDVDAFAADAMIPNAAGAIYLARRVALKALT